MGHGTPYCCATTPGSSSGSKTAARRVERENRYKAMMRPLQVLSIEKNYVAIVITALIKIGANVIKFYFED